MTENTIPLGTDRELYDASCKAIQHMCLAISEMSTQVTSDMLTDIQLEPILAGQNRRMNALGDILNGCDAVTEEDEWMNPIFGH